MPKFKLRFLRLPAGSDLILHICIVLLALFGVVMGISVAMPTATTTSALVNVGIRLGVYLVIGYIVMCIVANIFSFKLTRKLLFFLVVGTTALLLLALLFPAINGRYAWISLSFGGFALTIQPAEFAKVSILLVMAIYLGDLKTKT